MFHFMNKYQEQETKYLGSGCGSVGRAVAYDIRGPGFKSSHRQNLYSSLFTVNCIEKTKNKEKKAGNDPFLKMETK